MDDIIQIQCRCKAMLHYSGNNPKPAIDAFMELHRSCYAPEPPSQLFAGAQPFILNARPMELVEQQGEIERQ